MSVLRNIERKIGDLVEGAFGKTLRSGVQPVELARKLAKEMDDHRTISIHRVYVPNSYTVHLNPEDREQFAAYEQQMTNELEEYLAEHARREGYSLTTRPRVSLETEPELSVGLFGISVESSEPATEPVAGSLRRRCRCPRCPSRRRRRTWSLHRWCPCPCRRPTGETMVYAPVPAPEPEPEPEAPAGGGHAHMERRDGGADPPGVDHRPLRRAAPSWCTTPTCRARHAEIRRIGEGYSLVDLGSTNGTEVNGLTVSETALMNGDVISVGQTQLTFERRLG